MQIYYNRLILADSKELEISQLDSIIQEIDYLMGNPDDAEKVEKFQNNYSDLGKKMDSINNVL